MTDFVTPDVAAVTGLIESNHARMECANGHVVKTVQRDGKGPAFFPETCPDCAALEAFWLDEAEAQRQEARNLGV